MQEMFVRPVVKLIDVEPDWQVRVIEPTGRETVNSFPIERFAVAFAIEHCRRLRLETFERLEPF
jgi:hypothetical protein